MIAPLRARHRWLAPGAFGVAAVGLVLGVMARPKEFVEASHGLDGAAPVPAEVRKRLKPLAGEPKMSWALVCTDIHRGRTGLWELWLVAHERLEAPDILAYVVDGSTQATDALPNNAVLLGPVAPLGGSALEVSEGMALLKSYALYSLGQQRVIRRFGGHDFFPEDD